MSGNVIDTRISVHNAYTLSTHTSTSMSFMYMYIANTYLGIRKAASSLSRKLALFCVPSKTLTSSLSCPLDAGVTRWDTARRLAMDECHRCRRYGRRHSLLCVLFHRSSMPSEAVQRGSGELTLQEHSDNTS